MSNQLLKLGCFLTGYNYEVLKHCSESAKNKIKQLTSGIFIVSLLWFFIGFNFADRYIQLNLIGCITAGIIATFIIIQVERQIILTQSKSKYIALSRFLLAIIMSIIGSVIIDQILYKDDIEKKKEITILSDIERVYMSEKSELEKQQNLILQDIQKKDAEYSKLAAEAHSKPLIKVPKVDIIREKDSNNRYQTKQIINKSEIIVNPQLQSLKLINDDLERLRNNHSMLTDKLSKLRENIRQRLATKRGFLDELQILHLVLSESGVSLVFWLLLFLFILFLELLVLIIKQFSTDTDFDEVLKHQVDVRVNSLGKLMRK